MRIPPRQPRVDDMQIMLACHRRSLRADVLCSMLVPSGKSPALILCSARFSRRVSMMARLSSGIQGQSGQPGRRLRSTLSTRLSAPHESLRACLLTAPCLFSLSKVRASISHSRTDAQINCPPYLDHFTSKPPQAPVLRNLPSRRLLTTTAPGSAATPYFIGSRNPAWFTPRPPAQHRPRSGPAAIQSVKRFASAGCDTLVKIWGFRRDDTQGVGRGGRARRPPGLDARRCVGAEHRPAALVTVEGELEGFVGVHERHDELGMNLCSKDRL
ncbi:hypothetical protein LXA43DRAFT_507168 [Ganoderma leucocontextum]|nr:hypothetical protein LXA43DRAFT_507168 [Ganoderma leucocontextum]